MSNWQPIESAPKDGTAIWVVVDGKPYIGYCDPPNPPLRLGEMWILKASFHRRKDSVDEIYGCYSCGFSPVCWAPLPEPPK